jgi:hypothetical protein
MIMFSVMLHSPSIPSRSRGRWDNLLRLRTSQCQHWVNWSTWPSTLESQLRPSWNHWWNSSTTTAVIAWQHSWSLLVVLIRVWVSTLTIHWSSSNRLLNGMNSLLLMWFVHPMFKELLLISLLRHWIRKPRSGKQCLPTSVLLRR